MLTSIATARNECTAKHESKASHNTKYIIPDLIDFFTMIENIENRNICNCKKYCTHKKLTCSEIKWHRIILVNS